MQCLDRVNALELIIFAKCDEGAANAKRREQIYQENGGAEIDRLCE